MPDGQDKVAELQAELARVRARHAASESANARLQRELADTREQQAATADVLRVIASAPTETQRVLDDLVAVTGRMLASGFIVLHQRDGDRLGEPWPITVIKLSTS